MKEEYILAIDRGQTSIKAALCDKKAHILSLVSVPGQAIQSIHPGWTEQDMDLVWGYTVSAIRQLMEQSSIQPDEISAISFSGQGGGNFLIDQYGKPVRSGVLSLDSRHEEILDLIDRSKKADIPRTILFMRWLKEKEPESYQNTRWILGSKDWIRYQLTGSANADMSDAAAPLDLENKAYHTECCADAGVPECENMLPTLKYASEVCGRVTKEVADLCGLIAGTPVVAGAHDMIACAVGSGGIRQGHLAIIMGTLGINIAVVDQDTVLPSVDIPGEHFTFGGVLPRQRMVTTSIGSGGASMDWFLHMFFAEEIRAAKAASISIFEYLEPILVNREPSPIIFQPYLLGTFYNAAAKAGLFGITAATTREDLLLALFQGICISMCLEIERLERVVEKFQDIWLVGGGSNSQIWGQMFADILNRNVKIPVTGEVGCRGAAICAGLAMDYFCGPGEIPLPELKYEYKPRLKMHTLYEKQCMAYRMAYDAALGIW